jgi:membrane protein YqaA with SNARE-associated domain
MEAYLGLFASAFVAATLLPFYSEAALAAMHLGGYDPRALWLWATAGNTLGAAVNWALGRYLLHFQDRRWFPFKAEKLGRAQRWYQRWGVWSLLLAWLPVGGDALTFIAGLMRCPFGLFFVLTATGKGARYAVVLGLVALLDRAALPAG